MIAIRVTLRKLSRKRVGGRLTASTKRCFADRTVILVRGTKRIERARATRSGTFSFKLDSRIRGRFVRAMVVALSTPEDACAAGSSTFIKA